MLGRKERRFAPLVGVSLGDLVPGDHSLVREWVQNRCAARGRPAIDPVVVSRLRLVMFFERLRSECQLMRLVADRLSVRWYLCYDLDDPLPDHSKPSRIRECYGVEAFRRFFEAIVERCQAAGLVGGGELFIDATQVDANAEVASLRHDTAAQHDWVASVG